MSIAIGTQVEAVSWAYSPYVDDNITVPPGTQGTVNFVDDTGTIFVDWDNGRKLGITTADAYRVVRDSSPRGVVSPV